MFLTYFHLVVETHACNIVISYAPAFPFAAIWLAETLVCIKKICISIAIATFCLADSRNIDKRLFSALHNVRTQVGNLFLDYYCTEVKLDSVISEGADRLKNYQITVLETMYACTSLVIFLVWTRHLYTVSFWALSMCSVYTNILLFFPDCGDVFICSHHRRFTRGSRLVYVISWSLNIYSVNHWVLDCCLYCI